MKAPVWFLRNSKCWGRHISGICQICIFSVRLLFFFLWSYLSPPSRILLISLITHASASFQTLLLKDGQISCGPSYINHCFAVNPLCSTTTAIQTVSPGLSSQVSCFLPGTSGPSITTAGYMNTVKVSGWDMPGFTKTEPLGTSWRYNNPFTLPREVLHLQGNCVSVVHASQSEKHPPFALLQRDNLVILLVWHQINTIRHGHLQFGVCVNC